MWRGTWVLLSVVILGVLLLESAPAGAPEPVSSSPFGVVCPWPGMDQAGIRWCRVGAGATALANWPGIQPSPDVWDWAASDNELEHLLDPQGASVLPILGYTPAWASRDPKDASAQAYPPKDLAAFARYVRRCVERYKHRIKVWEVWNEPNIGFLRGNVADYAAMVKTAAVAAKQADPACRIAMGCAGVDLPYLQQLYEYGCGPYFDVMAVHPYQWGKHFNEGGMCDKLKACRALMNQHGDHDKEIWITEMGWSLGEGVNAEEQANLLAQALVTTLALRDSLRLEKFFWFSSKDWGSPGFGLFAVDGKPKPAFLAYQAVSSELSQARYLGPWAAPEGVRGHLFEVASQPVLVLWTPDPTGKIAVELPASRVLTVRNLGPQTTPLEPAQGKVTLEATHAPRFVRGLRKEALRIDGVAPAAAAAPAPRTPILRDVWVSIAPPATTSRPFAALGRATQLCFQIHNDSAKPAEVKLPVALVYRDQTLAQDEFTVAVAAGATASQRWTPTLAFPETLLGELATLRVQGRVETTALAPIELPIRLSRGPVIEFTANTWNEQAYLHKAERSGTAEAIRFGGEFGYRFELGNAPAGQLRMNVGANGANAWNLLLSTDDREYTLERSGQSWPGWQTVALDKYLAGKHPAPTVLYVKIQGNDCQVREVLLQSEPPRSSAN